MIFLVLRDFDKGYDLTTVNTLLIEDVFAI